MEARLSSCVTQTAVMTMSCARRPQPRPLLAACWARALALRSIRQPALRRLLRLPLLLLLLGKLKWWSLVVPRSMRQPALRRLLRLPLLLLLLLLGHRLLLKWWGLVAPRLIQPPALSHLLLLPLQPLLLPLLQHLLLLLQHLLLLQQCALVAAHLMRAHAPRSRGPRVLQHLLLLPLLNRLRLLAGSATRSRS